MKDALRRSWKSFCAWSPLSRWESSLTVCKALSWKGLSSCFWPQEWFPLPTGMYQTPLMWWACYLFSECMAPRSEHEFYIHVQERRVPLFLCQASPSEPGGRTYQKRKRCLRWFLVEFYQQDRFTAMHIVEGPGGTSLEYQGCTGHWNSFKA